MTGSPAPGPGGPPTSQIPINVTLPGATTDALNAFSGAVQSYADILSNESQKQELSLRPPGGQSPEVTYNAVLRARRAMSKHGERAKPGPLESIALAGAPTFSGATGVMGTFLHSPLQIFLFATLAFLAFVCIAYTVVRRVSS